MNDTDSDNHSDGDEGLPSELVAAIERARQRTTSNSMVEALTGRVLELTTEPERQIVAKSTPTIRNTWLYWVSVLAASIVLILSLSSWLTVPHEHAAIPAVELITQPIYSSITTVPLTLVGYRQVEEDLDRADTRIEELSEGLAIASVRQEIQKTLEEFYDWSK